MDSIEWDVVVVGAGNAGLCAALAAREQGAKVLVLERSPKEERGGNSTFTAGAIRFAYENIEDISTLVPNLTMEERSSVDFGSYPASQFLDDLNATTNYRIDSNLANILVSRSFDTLRWMRTKGVRFIPLYQRQTFEVEGKKRFWGGLTLGTEGGGPGLITALYESAAREGVEVWYESRGLSLLHNGSVYGVRVNSGGKTIDLLARTVVLASGGFEANAEMRTRYMGPGWDTVKVRGTRSNTGDGIRMALDIDAMSWGQWSGGHAVFCDRDAPPFGDLQVRAAYAKLSYPLGIVVNAHGDRFVDEGADLRNYTYAKYGREVLKQPGGFAWQVFDAKVAPSLLSEDYQTQYVTKVSADTLEELAEQLEGVDSERFLSTVRAYNEAVMCEVPFNPAIRDGRGTQNISPQKSNWANRLNTPPFEAYAVACGITYTFGGLRITSNEAQVIDAQEKPIPNLFAAGELVGGLFYDNYPGGSGLTAGSVFGRIAGATAACMAGEQRADAQVDDKYKNLAKNEAVAMNGLDSDTKDSSC